MAFCFPGHSHKVSKNEIAEMNEKVSDLVVTSLENFRSGEHVMNTVDPTSEDCWKTNGMWHFLNLKMSA
jgi:hypothetical protein